MLTFEKLACDIPSLLLEITGMNYSKFQHDLNIALESEILGELIFINAAKHCGNKEQQHVASFGPIRNSDLAQIAAISIQNSQTAKIRPHIRLQAKASDCYGKTSLEVALHLLKQGTNLYANF